jgi:predicted acetyltransferase
MHHLKLEAPRHELSASYRALVNEFAERGERPVPFVLSFPNENFPDFLNRLSACSRGENLPEGFVPHSTFFLVRNGSEVVGVSNLRHQLTASLRREGGNIGYGIRPSARGLGFGTRLLSDTLVRAREMGLSEAWLTCAKGNIASVRVIVRNRGELMSEEYVESRGEIVLRYRIDLHGDVDAL